ncbi:replication-relaxation family protein [Amycolatopsis sp. NPDC004747]
MSGHGRARRIAGRLTARDLAILESLWRLRLLTGSMIARLHVTAATPATRGRKTRAVMQRLTSFGLVVPLQRRIGGVRAGSGGLIFGLSGLGHAVLDLGTGGVGRRRLREPSPMFQDHLLAVAELYTQLVEAARAGQSELLEFTAEPTCWRYFTGLAGETIALKPDAFVRLVTGGYELSAFVEVDLATENLTRIAVKLGLYVRYWHDGAEQHRHGVFPRVWWLVPDADRRDALTRQVLRLPDDEQALFAVGLLAEATDHLTEIPNHEGGAR